MKIIARDIHPDTKQLGNEALIAEKVPEFWAKRIVRGLSDEYGHVYKFNYMADFEPVFKEEIPIPHDMPTLLGWFQKMSIEQRKMFVKKYNSLSPETAREFINSSRPSYPAMEKEACRRNKSKKCKK